MRKLAQRIAHYFHLGFYRPAHLDKLMQAGAITAEEREQILQSK